QGKVIALAAQPADNALGDIGKVGMMAERRPVRPG
ncbi:MAG: hypothetical protein AWU57_3877, partial [Marinobacter sp. T13-3]